MFANAQRQRKKVEALFAELKNQIGVRRLRLRRLKFVREQFFLGSGGAEHQATGAVASAIQQHPCLSATRNQRGTRQSLHHGATERAIKDFFNTHACYQQLTSGLPVNRARSGS